MARYRKIDPRIWNDEKFRAMSDNGKLLFFLLLTHPHMTSLGAMRGTLAGLGAELGWSEKVFRQAFQEAFSRGLVKYSEIAAFIWLPNFINYNKPENPNVFKSWESSFDLIPECELKNELIQSVKDFAKDLSKAFQDALPEVFRTPLLIQEQEHKQEKKEPANFSEEDFSLVHEMYESLVRINENHKKPDLNTWANTIRLMREKDKRTHNEIRSLWLWVNNHEFWQSNILSPNKLRAKWDQLLIQSKGKIQPRLQTEGLL